MVLYSLCILLYLHDLSIDSVCICLPYRWASRSLEQSFFLESGELYSHRSLFFVLTSRLFRVHVFKIVCILTIFAISAQSQNVNFLDKIALEGNTQTRNSDAKGIFIY